MNSPFFSLPSLELEAPEQQVKSAVQTWSEASPFLTVSTLNGKQPLNDSKTEQLVQTMSELYDEELEEAMEELQYEASDLYESYLENNSYLQSEHAARQMVLEHYVPMLGEIDRYFDRLIEKGSEVDQGRATVEDFEHFVDSQVAPTTGSFSVVQEQFLGKAFRKIGKTVKKAAGAVAKFTPIGLLLNTLRPKITQFLKGFLQKGIDKLPKEYQGMAQDLAKKLAPQAAEIARAAMEDPAESAEMELNAMLAHWITSPNARELELFEREMVRTAYQLENSELSLQKARQEFAQGIAQLKEGESPEPLMEQFLPALLPVVRQAIRLIGKDRVINTVSPLISGLISPLVGKENGKILGGHIARAGINMLGEVVPNEEPDMLAADAVTATVEDTIHQVADLPAHVLEDRQLLERYVIQAFENAAAANLPDLLQDKVYKANPKLRESDRHQNLMWKPAKVKKRGKVASKIKQLNDVFETELTPYMAQEIKTFGGISLGAYLRDSMGIHVNSSIPVRVYMVEGMPGSSRFHLSKYLKGLPGMGGIGREAWMQFHPLTSIAAGMLFNEPGVGCKHKGCLGNARNTQGHRYYYLDVPNARPQWFQPAEGRQTLRRVTGLKLKLDFFANEIKIGLYLSEADAQAIAVNLRKRMPETAHVMLMMALKQGLENVFKYGKLGCLKIVHPNVLPGKRSGMAADLLPPVVVNALGEATGNWVGSHLVGFLRDHPDKVVEAVEDYSDGMTLNATVLNPPDFDQVRQMLAGQTVSLQEAMFGRQPAGVRLDAKPGFQHV
ncbi:MAG: hypothetical protein SFV52_13350 [Saprospiraceae bacterium]|nr:hypothetical protein [Saprospiraceae bacterium]